MVVSSRFGADGAIGEAAAATPQKPARRAVDCKPMPEKLNETGTPVSERVHLREIVVIPGRAGLPGQSGAFRLVACRWPMAPI
jgi:hypothetical protein